MLQIDPEIVKNSEVFVVFDEIFVEIPRFFVKGSNNNNAKRAMHYIFCFKNTSECPNKSKKLKFLFLYNLCLLFESFWNQNDGKRSTKTELIILSAFKKIFSDFG